MFVHGAGGRAEGDLLGEYPQIIVRWPVVGGGGGMKEQQTCICSGADDKI